MELPKKSPPEHYRTKANLYSSVLRYVFDVRVDDKTKGRLASLISFARGIDDYLDEGDSQTLAKRTDEIIALLDNPDDFAAEYPALSLDQLGEDTYNQLNRLGGSILKINLHIKSTTSLKRYAKLRRLEGRRYAQLITAVASDEVLNQPGYDRFVSCFCLAGELSNLVNSCQDIHNDYKQGEIALVPDRFSRIKLLGHAALALR